MEDMELIFRGETAFITGATGFVGAWLVKALLDAGARVVCLIQDIEPESEFARSSLKRRVIDVRGSLTDETICERVLNAYEPRFIFHLGAQTLVQQALRSPLETLESNVRGTYLLLEAARRIRCAESIVVASSDKAYGRMQAEKYFEDHALAGEHPYDVSKSCTDLLTRMYGVTYKLPVSIARCGNIYGGGDTNWSRIVPGTIRSLFLGERPRLRSDGSMVRDYLHVLDVVRAYMAMAARTSQNPEGAEAFNFSAGEEFTVLQVVAEIQREMDCEHLEPLVLASATHEISAQVLDWNKARTILGWEPNIRFSDGIKNAVEWYKAGWARD